MTVVKTTGVQRIHFHNPIFSLFVERLRHACCLGGGVWLCEIGNIVMVMRWGGGNVIGGVGRVTWDWSGLAWGWFVEVFMGSWLFWKVNVRRWVGIFTYSRGLSVLGGLVGYIKGMGGRSTAPYHVLWDKRAWYQCVVLYNFIGSSWSPLLLW
jgi:hypothetical protein